MIINEPNNFLEIISSGSLKLFLRLVFKKFMGPPHSINTQRLVLKFISPSLTGLSGIRKEILLIDGMDIAVYHPPGVSNGKVILYIHGGAFCLGNADTHRSITTRLAKQTNSSVWVPNYRLAPEFPYPAALEDILSCYKRLLAIGYSSENIIVGGDSAGGSLALALALNLRSLNMRLPGKIFLLSPLTDMGGTGESFEKLRHIDPMLSIEWLEQAKNWYQYPEDNFFHDPLKQDLRGFPPLLIQVGAEEILLSDSIRLAEIAKECNVDVTLQVYEGRWHVFQLQATYLQSARSAIEDIAQFCME